MNSDTGHPWRFFRAGGFEQVSLQSGEDLVHLAELDQKWWSALACPTRGIEFDSRTLDLIDTDKDGRIRAPEVIAAVKWAVSVLRTPGALLEESDQLLIDTINPDHPEGASALGAARKILQSLGREGAEAITPVETLMASKVFDAMPFNGDGIILPSSTDDPALAKVLGEIVSATGGVADRSGVRGVSRESIHHFFEAVSAHLAWASRAETEPMILPLGARTAEAFAAFARVRRKVDDYFARCRLAAFDPRARPLLNRGEGAYATIAENELSAEATEFLEFPLALIEPGRPLPLREGLNPGWVVPIADLVSRVAEPLLGSREALTPEDWNLIQSKFAAFEQWQAEKAGTIVEAIGLDRLKQIAAENRRGALEELIARDEAVKPEADGLATIDKLAHFRRDLFKLLNNFVSFPRFYMSEAPAVFQCGTLFLDGRSCDLCVPVADPAKHAALAGLSKCYLAYLDCTRSGGEKMAIAAAFTNGGSDFLMVGRNGVFYDRKGRDWDATITRVIENPISIRQAFWSPYKKLVRLIEEHVARRAAAAEAKSDAKLSATAEATAHADAPRQNVPPARKVDVGTVAAISVAIAGIGALVTALTAQLFGLFTMPFWILCLVIAGILLIISGPSMLIAWLKLRQRSLAPILDANGWAINGQMKLNVPFGASLTQIQKLPSRATAPRVDRFAERPSLLPRLAAVAIAVAFLLSLSNHFGLLERLLAPAGAPGAVMQPDEPPPEPAPAGSLPAN